MPVIFYFQKMQKLKYVSDYSLLVHSSRIGLVRIKCPFRVIVTKTESDLEFRSKQTVNRVHQSQNHKLEYEINGALYPYSTFRILLRRIQ